MNHLVYNYLTTPVEVVDARTILCMIDLGFGITRRTRMQMLDSTWADDLRDPLLKEAACITLASLLHTTPPKSWGAYARGSRPPARQVVISPGRPDAYARSFITIYVQCERDDMLYPRAICPRVGEHPWLNVNACMHWCAERQFALSAVSEIMGALRPLDAVSLNF